MIDIGWVLSLAVLVDGAPGPTIQIKEHMVHVNHLRSMSCLYTYFSNV